MPAAAQLRVAMARAHLCRARDQMDEAQARLGLEADAATVETCLRAIADAQRGLRAAARILQGAE